MKKIRAILIDDDSFIVKILSDMIQENYMEIEVLGVANNGEEGIKKINRLKPDLVFLDIEMPDMNGFEMLSRIELIDFKTIFVTAHSQYAIKAFRFNALDYLLKPIQEEELKHAINRFELNQTEIQLKEIENALYNQKVKSPEDQRLALDTQNGFFSLPLKEIVFIEGDRNYSVIHKINGSKEMISKTLGYFDELLIEDGFFRSHRSYLVNSIFINKIQQEEFILTDKTKVPIARRKKNEAKLWFQNMA